MDRVFDTNFFSVIIRFDIPKSDYLVVVRCSDEVVVI